jgi:uncharacterized RDD family membrane protein YckC
MSPDALQPATTGKRIAAFAWDYLLIAGYVILLAIVSTSIWFGVIGQSPATSGTSPWLFDLLSFTTLVLPVILYFALCEASSAQATWGKRRVGLAVVSSDGGRLSKAQSLLRSALKFLPWQIAHSSLFHIPGWPTSTGPMPPGAMAGLALAYGLAGLYLVGLLRRPGHRTIYDGLAKTLVVTATSRRR